MNETITLLKIRLWFKLKFSAGSAGHNSYLMILRYRFFHEKVKHKPIMIEKIFQQLFINGKMAELQLQNFHCDQIEINIASRNN